MYKKVILLLNMCIISHILYASEGNSESRVGQTYHVIEKIIQEKAHTQQKDFYNPRQECGNLSRKNVCSRAFFVDWKYQKNNDGSEVKSSCPIIIPQEKDEDVDVVNKKIND